MNWNTDGHSQKLAGLAVVIASMTSLAACGGGGGGGNSPPPAAAPTPAGVPEANVSASTLTFSPMIVGRTTTVQLVTLFNSGAATVTISSIASSSGAFQAGGGTCTAGVSIPSDSSCTIDSAFAPSTAGALAATLLISHNAMPATSVVSLSAFATAAKLSAGSAPTLATTDCARLASGDLALASLAIQGADMQQVADILKATNLGHAYQVFARAPLNVMWWIRTQAGSIDMATIGAAIHEANHEVDFALASGCNSDRTACLLFDGSVHPTAVVSGNGSTPNYSIAAETMPAALKTGLRYATYITGSASVSGDDFSVLLDELNAYTGAAEFELGLLSDPVYKALRVDGNLNAGGQVNFMLYTLVS